MQVSKKQNASEVPTESKAAKAFRRSPFLEETKVIRCPVSLLPHIRRLLAERSAAVAKVAKPRR